MDSAGKNSSCIEVCPTHCIFSVLGSFEILASPTYALPDQDLWWSPVIYQCEKPFSFSSDWSTSAGSQGNRHTEWAGSISVLPSVTTGFSVNGEAVSPALRSTAYLVLLEGMSWRWLASVISWFSVKEMTLTNQSGLDPVRWKTWRAERRLPPGRSSARGEQLVLCVPARSSRWQAPRTSPLAGQPPMVTQVSSLQCISYSWSPTGSRLLTNVLRDYCPEVFSLCWVSIFILVMHVYDLNGLLFYKSHYKKLPPL